jgi:hypothetical protein
VILTVSPALPGWGRVQAVVATLLMSNYEAELNDAATVPSSTDYRRARQTRGSRLDEDADNALAGSDGLVLAVQR